MLSAGQLYAQQFTSFHELSVDWGIDYAYPVLGEYTTGVSAYDFNGDGLDDISFGGSATEDPFFFQNTGNGFTQVSFGNLGVNGQISKALIWADFDNDGDDDLSIGGYYTQTRLYSRVDSLSVVDISDDVGIPTIPIWAFASAWGDYDNNGHLDFYLGSRDYDNDLFNSPNMLLRNNGDLTFTDVSFSSMAADTQGLGLGVVFTDYNRDNWPDIYIGNDRYINHNTLLKNNGDGTFEDVSDPASTGMIMDGMGIAAGDYTGNGFEDLYCTNTPSSSDDFGGNILCRNHGNGEFTDVADSLGMRVFRIGWGCNFADFDNDGDLDLFVANADYGVNESPAMPNTMFINQGDGTFNEDVGSVFESVFDKTYGSAVGDFNDDGYPDIALMNEWPSTFKLWINDGGSYNWVKITLEGTLSNRMGVGSWIEVHSGGEVQQRYTHCGMSFGSQDGKANMFGLRSALWIDSIVVRWPSGVVDVHELPGINQTHHFVEGAVITDEGNSNQASSREVEVYPNPTTGTVILSGVARGSQVTIFDIYGKEVLNEVARSTSERLDLTEQLGGTYLISIVEPDNRLITKRIVLF